MSQDYSIYAYDYSEPGVPLVGCGLLSWAMATVNSSSHGSENPTPTRHIITGRISCNNFGFFSNDEVKETLEVKFKLAPVQTFTQAQFVQSVHTYNALSKAIPGGFDASAWTNYLNQHPNILAPPPHCSNTPALTVPFRAPGERALCEPLLVESQSTQKRPSQQPKPNKLSRDGDGLFTSAEESGEPPKKKARNNAARVRKPSGGSRKKGTAVLPPAPLSPIPELFPPPVPQFKPVHVPAPPTPSPPEDPAELVRGSVSNRSFASLEVAFSHDDENSPAPPTVNSAVMASSPPTGHDDSTEELRAEYSPEPTSPVLPSLPGEEVSSLSQEYARELEDLFKDIKPEVMNHDSLPAKPPASATLQPEQKTPVPSSSKPPSLSTLGTLPDDMTMSAAPSPNPSHEIIQPKPKPKRKYPRKPKTAVALATSTIPSDAVVSSDIGEEGRNAKRSKSEKAARTAANVKERIHAQMVAAINEGKMPNYCMNCGAIETPTWRKVSMKDDSEGGEEGDGKGKKEKEVLLCNPCGLWHGSHKTMRPQDYWDGKKEEPAPKKPRSKKKKKPVSTIPVTSSQAARQPSEPCTEPIIVPDEDEEQGLPMPPPSINSTRRLAMTPKGDRSAKGSVPEWEAASAASKRAFLSSPAKCGSAASPIDLENLECSQSPRRLLFPTKPSPNRSPIRKLLDSGAETRRSNLTAVAGKENRAPEGTGTPMVAGREIQRPATPTKKRVNLLHPRTPLSSPMKGGKLISPSPWNADIFVSGGKRRACGNGISVTPEKRTAQPLVQQCTISPTSELLEKIMSMADMPPTNTIPLDSAGTSPDPPGMSPIDPNQSFDFGDNIFGTDMTMPSSPPPLFNLGDATEDEVNGWGEFLPSSPEFNNMDYGLDIFENMTDVRGAAEMGGSVKSEKCSSVGTTLGATALTVDFSSYIDEATKSHDGRLTAQTL